MSSVVTSRCVFEPLRRQPPPGRFPAIGSLCDNPIQFHGETCYRPKRRRQPAPREASIDSSPRTHALSGGPTMLRNRPPWHTNNGPPRRLVTDRIECNGRTFQFQDSSSASFETGWNPASRWVALAARTKLQGGRFTAQSGIRPSTPPSRSHIASRACFALRSARDRRILAVRHFGRQRAFTARVDSCTSLDDLTKAQAPRPWREERCHSTEA